MTSLNWIGGDNKTPTIVCLDDLIYWQKSCYIVDANWNEIPLSETEQIDLLKKNTDIISKILFPSKKAQLFVVEKDWSYIKDILRTIRNPDEEVFFKAVNNNWFALSPIYNFIEEVLQNEWREIELSERTQIAWVKQSRSAIKLLKKPVEEAQIIAIEEAEKKGVKAIKFIDFPTPKVEKYVLEKDWRDISLIKNPTPQAREFVEEKRKPINRLKEGFNKRVDAVIRKI